MQQNNDKKNKDNWTFCLIDGDKLKRINSDSYNAAELIIQLIGFAIKKICNNHINNILSYHWGGDEYCILFKNCKKEFIINIIESLIKDIRKSTRITISIGLTNIIKNIDNSNIMFERAELNLKYSKINGGNQYQWDYQLNKINNKDIDAVDVKENNINETKVDQTQLLQSNLLNIRDLLLLQLFLKAHNLGMSKSLVFC